MFFKRLITYLYVKYVFIPGLLKIQEQERTKAIYNVDRCDPHWQKIENAMLEKHFNTVH